MKTLVCLGLLSTLVGVHVERQLEHPWGRWQPGAWVETRTSIDSAPEGLLERTSLLRCTADGVDLETSTGSEGQGTGGAAVASHQSWGFGGFAHVLPGARQVGQETLTVAGKPYECTVWEGSWQEGSETFVARSWTCEAFDLPLRCRMASPSGGYEATLVEPRDWVRMKGRKLPAARYEGSGRSKGTAVTLRQWMSLDVPGGTLRMETSLRADGATRHVVREVTAFRCVPLAGR